MWVPMGVVKRAGISPACRLGSRCAGGILALTVMTWGGAPAQAKASSVTERGAEMSRFKVGARVMAQAGYRFRPDEAVNAEEHRGQLNLRQARIKFRYKSNRWRMKLSVDLSDGVAADGDRPLRYVRDAYAQWQPNKKTRVRFGVFKRPYSSLAWESANQTFTISRGLVYRYGIRRRNSNLSYGMRGLGVMVWHKYRTGLGKGRIYASLSQNELDLRSVAAHVLVRQKFGSAFTLDLFSAYKRSVVANEGVHTNASGASARVSLGALSMLAEFHAMQNWQMAQRPWAIAAQLSAFYGIVDKERWTLGPMAAVEWINFDVKRDTGRGLRAAAGARAQIAKRVGIWLEGEWQDRLSKDALLEVKQRQLRLRLQVSVSL